MKIACDAHARDGRATLPRPGPVVAATQSSTHSGSDRATSLRFESRSDIGYIPSRGATSATLRVAERHRLRSESRSDIGYIPSRGATSATFRVAE
jgi:hypothetical protein